MFYLFFFACLNFSLSFIYQLIIDSSLSHSVLRDFWSSIFICFETHPFMGSQYVRPPASLIIGLLSSTLKWRN